LLLKGSIFVRKSDNFASAARMAQKKQGKPQATALESTKNDSRGKKKIARPSSAE
jgi:hypothetical protein